MIDGFGRVDTMVIRNNATEAQILAQWRRLLEIPATMALDIRSGNHVDYYWTYHSNPETVPWIFRTMTAHGNACIFDGPDQFKAEQIGRILDIFDGPDQLYTYQDATNCAVSNHKRGGWPSEYSMGRRSEATGTQDSKRTSLLVESRRKNSDSAHLMTGPQRNTTTRVLSDGAGGTLRGPPA
jgi:hypothetical protein